MENIAQSSYLNWLMQEQLERQQQVQMYRAYYDGDPPTLLTDRMAAFLNVSRDKKFGANICATVVDTLTERLQLTGFDVRAKETGEDDEELATQLDDWWEANRMDAVQAWVHTAGVRDAESFVIVGYDGEEKRPSISHDFAYDGTSGVKIHYEPGTYNKLACASKRWLIDLGPHAGKKKRLNLYFPDRIEKWVCDYTDSRYGEAMWWPYEDADDPTLHMEAIEDEAGRSYTASVSWWTDTGTAVGKPLGVPVIPFINRNDGAGRGLSEIDNVIPLQDVVNKTLIDMAAAADMTGFQMIWHTGPTPPGGWKIYPGTVFELTSDTDYAPTMGTIPAGNVDGLINLWKATIEMAAGISATPQARFTPAAVRPAEGTQKQEESALVAKAEKLQDVWGNAWEDVMRMALKVEAAFGEAGTVADVVIKAAWKDAQSRNEMDAVNVASMKVEKLAVPVEVAWREVGYSAGEIRDMKAQRAREKAAIKLQVAREKAAQPPVPPAQPAPVPVGNEPLQPNGGGPTGMQMPQPSKGIFR